MNLFLAPDYRRQLMIFRKKSKHNLRDEFDLITNDKDLLMLSQDTWHCERSQITCETLFFVQVDKLSMTTPLKKKAALEKVKCLLTRCGLAVTVQWRTPL